MNEILAKRGALNGLGVAKHGQIYPKIMNKKTTKECFDDLEKSAIKIQALLNDRQEGLMVWNQMLKENGEEMIKCLQNLGFPVKLGE